MLTALFSSSQEHHLGINVGGPSDTSFAFRRSLNPRVETLTSNMDKDDVLHSVAWCRPRDGIYRGHQA